MAHPSRGQMAGRLAEEVDADRIIVDWGQEGELSTGIKTWDTLADLDTDWSIVLQDDALPVLDFRKHAALALSRAPQTAVSFYVGTCRPRQRQVREAIDEADRLDAPWLQADRMLWGPGIAMPTSAIPALVEYWANGRDPAYDQRIGFFWQRQGIPINYTWPSLVDHADGGSLVQKRDVPCPRVAHRIGTRESWEGPVVRIAAR